MRLESIPLLCTAIYIELIRLFAKVETLIVGNLLIFVQMGTSIFLELKWEQLKCVMKILVSNLEI